MVLGLLEYIDAYLLKRSYFIHSFSSWSSHLGFHLHEKQRQLQRFTYADLMAVNLSLMAWIFDIFLPNLQVYLFLLLLLLFDGPYHKLFKKQTKVIKE